MRVGHNSSSSSKEGFQPAIDLHLSLMAVEQSQLVDQHRSKSESCCVDEPSGGDLPVQLEDGLEMLVEVLVGHAAQLVEDAPDFDAIVGVRVSPSFSGNQKPLPFSAMVAAGFSDVGGVVVDVSEHEAGILGQLLDEVGSHRVVRRVSGGEPGRQRNPDPTDGDGQVQLPAVDPPVPTRLGPVGLGVYCCMGHLARFLVFLVPHPAFCPQSGGVEGYGPSPALPRLEHFYQVASQAADLLGEPLGQSLQTSLEGAPAGEASLLAEQLAHHAHLGGGFVEDRQELSHLMQPPYDHDHQGLQEELLRIDDGPAAAPTRWWWRTWDALEKADQLDKDTLLIDHGGASESSVFGHPPSRRFLALEQVLMRLPIYDRPSIR